MSHPATPEQLSMHVAQSGVVPQPNRWLPLARAVWVIVTALVLTMYIGGLPSRVVHGLNNINQLATEEIGLSRSYYVPYVITLEVVVALAFFAAALLIFWRAFDDPVAILVAITLLSYGTGQTGFTYTLVDLHPVWGWIVHILGAVGELLSLVIFYVFPDGRFVPRWTRPLTLLYTAWVLLCLLDPNIPFNVVYGDSFNKTPLLSLLIAVAWHSTGLVALLYRYQHTTDTTQRRQMKWVVVGLIIAFLASVTSYAVDGLLRVSNLNTVAFWVAVKYVVVRPVTWLGVTVVPFCIAFAMLRYRLWDVVPIINRTLVYGTLTASTLSIYIIVVGALGAVLQTHSNLLLSLMGTGVVAVIFQPLREHVQRGVNRLMYGERDDPSTVLNRLGQRLESTLAADATPMTIVTTLTETLKLPYAAIALTNPFAAPIPEASPDREPPSSQAATEQVPAHRQHLLATDGYDIVAAAGLPQPELLRLTLVYQSSIIGLLLVAPRHPDEPFSPADLRLLTTLAPQVASAVQAARLTLDLQRARERLVAAREEERRRLRRDLHDGLGPALASQVFMVDTILKLLEQDAGAVVPLLRELKAQSQMAMGDVRRLVDGLRPPALDDLGLVGALREQIATYRATEIEFRFVTPPVLPPLPAAVEVAAYRITQEAMLNTVRHAQARTCLISLSIGEGLHLSIRDDGRGFSTPLRRGTGLESMRERAAEVGGVCEVVPEATGGTCVRAWLPLR